MLGKVKIGTKLAGAITLLVIAMGIIYYQQYQELTHWINLFENEVSGVKHIRKITQLTKHIALHRGYGAIFASGNRAVAAQLDELDRQIVGLLKDLEELEEKSGEQIQVQEGEARARGSIEKLLSGYKSFGAKQSYIQHTAINAELLVLKDEISVNANIDTDPERDTYYIISVLVFDFYEYAEILGQIRGLSTGIATRKTITPQERLDLEKLLFQQIVRQTGFLDAVEHAIEYTPELKSELTVIKKATEESASVTRIVDREILKSEIIVIRPSDLIESYNKILNNLWDAAETMEPILEKKLVNRLAEYRFRLYTGAAISLFTFLIAGFLVFLIVSSITGGIGKLVGAFKLAADGDMTARVDVRSQDEVGILSGSFNTFMHDLSELVAEVKSIGTEIGVTSEGIKSNTVNVLEATQTQLEYVETAEKTLTEIVSNASVVRDNIGTVDKSAQDAHNSMTESLRGTLSNAAYTEEQNCMSRATLRELHDLVGIARVISESSLEMDKQANKALQLVSDVQESAGTVASSARDANEQATQALKAVENGEKVLENMIHAIESINDSSRQINEIIDTITDITDQTNMLSLNAAIEAARAGEYGKGFAVVAEAVRSLAERSAEAANEIANNIRENIKRVEEGTRLTEDVKSALKEIRESSLVTTSSVNKIQEIGTSNAERAQQMQVTFDTLKELSASVAKEIDGQNSNTQTVETAIAGIVRLAAQVTGVVNDQIVSFQDVLQLADGMREKSLAADESAAGQKVRVDNISTAIENVATEARENLTKVLNSQERAAGLSNRAGELNDKLRRFKVVETGNNRAASEK